MRYIRIYIFYLFKKKKNIAYKHVAKRKDTNIEVNIVGMNCLLEMYVVVDFYKGI